MRIEFIPKTPATIVDVDIQSLKMGQKDVKPAVCLHLKLMRPNHTLAMLDGNLLAFLYEKATAEAGKQKTLDGVDVISDMPQLTTLAKSIGVLNWDGEQTGCMLVIYQGVTGDQDIKLRDCTVRKVKVDPKEGGATEWCLQVYTADVDQDTIGALGVLKSLDRDIELVAAKVADNSQQDLADEKKDPVTPEAALTAAAGGGSASGDGGTVWPFPGGKPATSDSQEQQAA